MMSSKDFEQVRFMAEVWRLNDLRNQKIAAEKQRDQARYKVVDDPIQE
jgi:hypothetical protein